MAPDLSAEVDSGEDGGGVDPDIVKDVGLERSDKGKGMGVKVWDAGDVMEEVPINEFFLWDPKLLSVVVNNGVLMGVTVDCKGTGGGAEEVGKNVS